MSSKPRQHALCRGVFPVWSRTSTLAPAQTSLRTTATWRVSTAMCNGVCCRLLVWLSHSPLGANPMICMVTSGRLWMMLRCRWLEKIKTQHLFCVLLILSTVKYYNTITSHNNHTDQRQLQIDDLIAIEVSRELCFPKTCL